MANVEQLLSGAPDDGSSLGHKLRQLVSTAHNPRTEFDHLLLVLHCLMVEAGFQAVVSPDEAAAEAPDYRLQLQGGRVLGSSSSAAIVYVYRLARTPNCGQQRPFALLKVVNAAHRLAVCHCGVAGSAREPPTACASGHFNTRRYVTLDEASGVASFSELGHLSVGFKDCIVGPTKAAIHEASGLPPPVLPGLPIELLHRVLRSCDFASVCRLAQANQRLAALCSDNLVWRDQLRRSGADASYSRARTAELRGEDVNYCRLFRDARDERRRTARALARRGSRELLAVLPQHQQQQQQRHPTEASLRRHGLTFTPVGGGGGSAGAGGRRYSLNLLLPESADDHRLLEQRQQRRWAELGEEFVFRGSSTGNSYPSL